MSVSTFEIDSVPAHLFVNLLLWISNTILAHFNHITGHICFSIKYLKRDDISCQDTNYTCLISFSFNNIFWIQSSINNNLYQSNVAVHVKKIESLFEILLISLHHLNEHYTLGRSSFTYFECVKEWWMSYQKT